MVDLKEYEALLTDVENRVDRLRALYEQYFQGIERLEPLIPKKEVERRIARLRKTPTRNTALRFRTNQLIQKYTTYQTYWIRVARQIEEGTYRRDVLKARRRREDAREERKAQRERDRESQRPAAFELDIDIDVDVESEINAALDAVERKSSPPVSPLAPPTSSRPPVPSSAPPRRGSISPFARPAKSVKPASPGAPASATFGKPRDPVGKPASPAATRSFGPPGGARPPSVARPARPAPAAPGGNSDGPDIRRVYDNYIEARRRNNERTDNVRYETIEKNIKKMMPKLQQKHRGKKIDFEVVVKDGKVGLKPVPKK